MNTGFMSIQEYVECKAASIGKIATYDILIANMENAMLTAITSGHLIQYEMDDGQMKVRAQYRNITDMTQAMQGLIKLRQMYINRANGNSIRLVGGNL